MKRKAAQMFLVAVSILLSNMCIPQAQAQSWNTMTSGTTTHLYGVWGSSATDVFAVGDMSTILHYDGMSWAPMAAGTEYLFACVWGSSATDVFAGGSNGAILHYNGTAWALMASNAPAGTRIESIWGSAGNDVFAVGGNGVILHYDGANWAPNNLPLSMSAAHPTNYKLFFVLGPVVVKRNKGHKGHARQGHGNNDDEEIHIPHRLLHHAAYHPGEHHPQGHETG